MTPAKTVPIIHAKNKIPIYLFSNIWETGQIVQPSILQELKDIARIPSVQGVFMMPDVVKEEVNTPNGILVECDVNGGMLMPSVVRDVNCGYRLAATNIKINPREVASLGLEMGPVFMNAMQALTDDLNARHSLDLGAVLESGAEAAIQAGFGTPSDTLLIEDHGRVAAEKGSVSEGIWELAVKDLYSQFHYGHFIELGVVDRVYEPDYLSKVGIEQDRLLILIHGGSMKAGSWAYEEYLEKTMLEAVDRHYLPNPMILGGMGAAPIDTPLGRQYFEMLQSLTNFAYARRQISQTMIERALGQVFPGRRVKARLLSDTPHTKLEIIDHRVIQRSGVQRLNRPPGLSAICSSQGLPSFLIRRVRGSKYYYAGHGRTRNTLLRNSVSFEDWQLINQMQQSVYSNNTELLQRNLRERAYAQHLYYQNTLDSVSSLENYGVIRRVARFRPLVVFVGLPKKAQISTQEIEIYN